MATSRLRKIIFSVQNEIRLSSDDRLLEALDLLTEVELERSGWGSTPENDASNAILPDVSGSLPCDHHFIQKDTYWQSCMHCGMLKPLGQ